VRGNCGVTISAQSEHFSVLALKVSHSKFCLFQPIFRHLDPDPDSEYGFEYGSGSRPNLNADPTGSGSETLHEALFLFIYDAKYRLKYSYALRHCKKRHDQPFYVDA
jgi:hypothetical protein